MFASFRAREDIPHLKGGGLVLRGPRAGDYAAWRAIRLRSRDFLTPFEPRWSEADLDQRIYNARLRRIRREALLGTDFSFFIFEGHGRRAQLVGGLTLSNIRRRAAQCVTLGYWMGVDTAGRGVMTRAVGLVVPFVFDGLGLHRIQAACLPHNMASRRVLEKNGFREEGYAEHYLQIDGAWRDHVLFALTRERYEGHAEAFQPV